MFDKVVREKFQDSTDDAAVRDQAIKMLKMFRAGKTHGRIITDVLHASMVARRTSNEEIAEIGFLMGMQFGFELELSFPPLEKQREDGNGQAAGREALREDAHEVTMTVICSSRVSRGWNENHLLGTAPRLYRLDGSRNTV